MQQLSRFLLPKVILPNVIRKLNINNSQVNKTYKFSFKKNVTEMVQHVFHDLNNWYVNVIGLAEVQKYQDRVVNVQAQLLETQEKRREISKELADVRARSNELQDQIHKLKREDDLDKFLDVMRKETEILKKEKEISRIFSEYDRTERDLFTAFTNAVRESHEKQRSQLEYTKYLGLGLSIAGSFLTFCYSSLKKHELKSFIDEKLSIYPVPVKGNIVEMQELRGLIDVLKKDTTKLLSQNINIIKDNHNELVKVLNALNGNIITLFKAIPKHGQMVSSDSTTGNSQNAQNVAFENNVDFQNVNWFYTGLVALFVFSILRSCC